MEYHNPATTARKAARTRASTFPLFQRSDGRWAKKIAGVQVYFGTDKAAALEKYNRHVGLVAIGLDPATDDGVDLGTLFDAYLANQRAECESGNIGARSVSDSASTLRRITAALGGRSRAVVGLTAVDFAKAKAALSKGRSPVTMAGDIRRTKAAFRWGAADDVQLLKRLPAFGQFKGPPKRVVELAKSKREGLIFEPAELRLLIEAANPQLRAMIFLGVNAALLPVDLSRLELADFSTDLQWLAQPRFKTGVSRRAWLWEETREAIRAAQAVRTVPRSGQFQKLLFLTENGNPVVRSTTPKKAALDSRFELNVSIINRPTADFRELCQAKGVYRHGRGFGQLRHVFLTVAEGGLDFIAVSKVMGHRVPGATSHYRHHIADDRIKACCGVVHSWLFPPATRQRKTR